MKAGAGVGSQLTYVSGRVYLAGPFGGAPLSAVAIVPAVAGPFDVGTVVYRQALRVDPKSALVTADGGASDPLPRILAGIPLVVRDVQVSIDRSSFTLNPTSCDPFATKASLWGSGANPLSALDDSPVNRSARYQAASCQSLAFKPSLSLKLKGGTRRGTFPALRPFTDPRSGDANLRNPPCASPIRSSSNRVISERSAPRVQYTAGAGNESGCPADSVYGHAAEVFTPILDQPVEGPVFLRSSDNNLPDVVLALHGPPSLPVHVEVPARIDSVHGGLRAIAAGTPDIPVTKAIVSMQGGQKGLFVNSTNICASKHRANVNLDAQNGKSAALKPLMRSSLPQTQQGLSPARSESTRLNSSHEVPSRMPSSA